MSETKNLRWFEWYCRIVMWIGAVAFGVSELWNRLNPLPRDNPIFWIMLLLSVILFLATLIVGFCTLNERGKYLQSLTYEK